MIPTRDHPETVTFADLAFEYEPPCRAKPDEPKTCLPPTCHS